MPSIPPPDNRVLLTVGALKEEISNGKFGDVLPGERELSNRFQVSRKTLRKAMDLLEDEQWISPARHGCRRQILATLLSPDEVADKPTLSQKKVVLMSPHELIKMGSIERLFQSRLARHCEKVNIHLSHRGLDVRHMSDPSHRLQEFTKSNPADVYLLQHSNQKIQLWFEQQKIPCIVLGTPHKSISLPAVDGDMKAVATHTAALLQRYQHHNVAMLFPIPAKRGLEVFVTQIKQVNPNTHFTLIEHEETPEATGLAVRKALTIKTTACTVVLSPNVFTTVSVVSSAAQLDIRIPEDLSVICLAHDELLSYLQPPITSYQFNWENYTKSVFKSLSTLLLHPHTPVNSTSLTMPEFIQGASLQKIDCTR